MLHDIALLRLKTKLTRTAAAHEVCLPSNYETFVGQNCIVTGWGYLAEGIICHSNSWGNWGLTTKPGGARAKFLLRGWLPGMFRGSRLWAVRSKRNSRWNVQETEKICEIGNFLKLCLMEICAIKPLLRQKIPHLMFLRMKWKLLNKPSTLVR